jgi:hypothetical protein
MTMLIDADRLRDMQHALERVAAARHTLRRAEDLALRSNACVLRSDFGDLTLILEWAAVLSHLHATLAAAEDAAVALGVQP